MTNRTLSLTKRLTLDAMLVGFALIELPILLRGKGGRSHEE